MLTNIIRKSIKKVAHIASADLGRNQKISTDVLLASYPKSGNTWLRFMLANYLVSYFDLPIQSNWFTVQDLIPDRQAFLRIPNENLVSRHYGSRILKTHETFSIESKRVILLTRKPEDAIASCYNYYQLNGLIDVSMSFGEFLYEHELGIDGWNEHTLGWLNNYQIGSIVRFFRFEDFKSKPEETLSEIVDLLGLNVDSDMISSAVNRSSKDNMARSEIMHRSSVVLRVQGQRFVGSGKVGRAREVASEQEISDICQRTKEAREILGY
jgi:hypothetical protein